LNSQLLKKNVVEIISVKRWLF